MVQEGIKQICNRNYHSDVESIYLNFSEKNILLNKRTTNSTIFFVLKYIINIHTRITVCVNYYNWQLSCSITIFQYKYKLTALILHNKYSYEKMRHIYTYLNNRKNLSPRTLSPRINGTLALRITSNKLHRGHTNSVSASNCGSSLYNFLSSIQS
uniref:Uncharacterized protein n=1 Tax=Heterorhabditis bacteriophora TaxID=37862 RepID=A0A1I7WE85_HETBA